MKRLAVIGHQLTHKFIYPGHINGFDVDKMRQFGGWMADMHRGRDGSPLNRDVRVVAIASSDASAGEIAEACFIDHVYKTVEELPPDSVDGVLILENDGAKHLQLARPFLERGKFVYCDKPVATTVSDLEEMQRLAMQNDAIWMGGSALRYSPKLQAATRFIAQKRPTGLTIVGPGTWYDYACHTVEALQVLFGNTIVSVQPVGNLSAGAVAIQWQDGALATLLFGRGYEPLFRIHAFFMDEMKEWIIDDAYDYYLSLSKVLVQRLYQLPSDVEQLHPWEDLHAITSLLETVGRQIQ